MTLQIAFNNDFNHLENEQPYALINSEILTDIIGAPLLERNHRLR